jgi:hypothetical protein
MRHGLGSSKSRRVGTSTESRTTESRTEAFAVISYRHPHIGVRSILLRSPRRRALIVEPSSKRGPQDQQCQPGKPAPPTGPWSLAPTHHSNVRPRKRAGLQPWLISAICIGCPLPQFGTPQATHSSGPAIPSQLPQNFGVTP